ncbi:MAG: TolC family protein [Rhodoferax sp.]|nr:TolC family protein [Rhodoferax sp.]
MGFAVATALVQAQSLPELLERAVTTHPSVQGQRSQRAVAAAELDYARQQFYPTPSVSIEQVSAARQDPSYLQNATVKIFRLQQPLWTHGRLTAGVEKAQASADATANNLDDVRQQLALRVLQAWADGYAAELKQTALQTSVFTHQRLQAQVGRRVDDGASAPTEKVLTDGRLAQTRAQLQAVVVQAETARMRLEQLTGAPIAAALLSAPLRELPDMDAAQAVDASVKRSPAVRRLQATVRVQEADVVERKSERFPEVYARAEYQIGNAAVAGVPDAQRLFVGLQSKLGAGLSTFSGIDAAENKVAVARADVENAQRALAEQVLADWTQRATVQARLVELEASLQASRATALAWDRQFLAGRKSWVEVMNSARELAQAETDLADLLTARVLLSWRLALYTQGLDSLLPGKTNP